MSYSPLWLVKTQAKQTLRGMDEQARANFVQEVLPGVKAVVLSADYAKQHDDYIRTSHQAINHGVRISETSPKLPEMR